MRGRSTRFLVGTAAGQRIEDVGDGHDSRLDRNVVPPQSARISAAVHRFMMVQRDVAEHVDVFEAVEAEIIQHHVDDLPPFGGMAAHDGALLVGKGAGLAQDLVGDRDLSDVMERGEEKNMFDQVVGQAVGGGDRLCNQAGEVGHAI